MNRFLRFLLPLAGFMFVAGAVVGVITNGEAASSTGAAETGEQPKPECLSDPSVLNELQSQREELAKEQKELGAKEAELKTREQAMVEELKKLEALRDEINKTDALKAKDNQEKIAKLIETLETMSPKACAKILAELDDTLAVAAISKMDTARLAKVMNLLDPKRASKLSEILAGVARPNSANAVSQTVAAAEVTKKAMNPTGKGGEKNDQHNQDNINDSSARAPGSISGSSTGSQAKGSH